MEKIVATQTSVKSVESSLPLSSDNSLGQQFGTKNNSVYVTKSWMTVKEPIGVWSDGIFIVQGILEHLNVTKDYSDYLWYISRIYISDEDISFWEENNIGPAVKIDSMRDALRVFVNGQLEGTVIGRWVKVFQPVHFVKGYNDLVFLSQTVGL
ncbi:beta-galactosidase 9-like [Humulus lupulus]|uniref:beta-galactosidase 9-like n=1 Tax=Humulus lupulus TaxID=3486 RepID=UPI002B403B07|nr:beta-galactosidase 9-like [Humulus lupulus]